MLFNPITCNEIIEIVKHMKNNTSPGFDSISVEILKRVIDIIVFPLCDILNCSIQQGVVPTNMKISKIIPIHKKGDREDMNNYRPIAVLPVLSKILERCIYNRLMLFLNKNNVLYQSQYGFRNGHSTSSAILQLIQNINKSLNNNDKLISVFIDLTKAFDVIDHKILIYKLSYYGIKGIPLQWFIDYLCNRKQYVYVNGKISNQVTVECGVPQGSILGPLLFLIYINDIHYTSDKLNYILFADDTSVYLTGNNTNSLISSMNNQLKHIDTWMKRNHLILNVCKTKYMIFGSNSKNVNNNILLFNDCPIQCVKEFNFLGVIIDEKLSWNSHISQLNSKLSKNIGILNKVRFLTQDTLKVLYHSFITSYLSYCNVIWGFTCKTNLNRIHILQKKAIRIVTHSNYMSSTKPLFKKTNILPIYEMCNYNVAKFMYQCYNNLLPKPFEAFFLFNKDVHAYNTRNKDKFHLPLMRKQVTKLSIFYEGPLLWNTIPDHVIKSKSLNQFKRKYKQLILEKM